MKQKQGGRKSFDSTIKGLAKANSGKNAKEQTKEQTDIVLLAHFIRRELKRFRLENVDLYDVIHEVYLRGENKITSGEDIVNAGAWIRVASYNVIREMSRKQQKEQANSDFIELHVTPDNSEETNEVELILLKQSLQSLNKKDRQILELRFFKNLSWKQVVAYLASEGETLTEATARQRGKRALQHLKKAYLSVKFEQLSA